MGSHGEELVPGVPVFESPDDLLEEDDPVGDGLVPLHLQQHVVVVLGGRAPERRPPHESKQRPSLPSLGFQAWGLAGPHRLPALLCSVGQPLPATGQREVLWLFPGL